MERRTGPAGPSLRVNRLGCGRVVVAGEIHVAGLLQPVTWTRTDGHGVCRVEIHVPGLLQPATRTRTDGHGVRRVEIHVAGLLQPALRISTDAAASFRA